MTDATLDCPNCGQTEHDSDFSIKLDLLDGMVINADRGCPNCEHEFETEETKRFIGAPMPCANCKYGE